MNDRQAPLWQALVGVLFCSFLWGSAFPSIKTVYRIWAEQGLEVNSATRFWFAGVRFTIAGGALLLLAKNPIMELKKTPKLYLIGMMMTQTFLQYILFYTALVYSSGSLASLMTASGSFWWLLLAPLFGRSGWGGWKVWGILCLGAIGVGLVVYSPNDISTNPVLGMIIMLSANLCGALAVLIFGKVKATMGARTATGYSLFSGGIGLCLVALSAIPQSRQMFSPPVIIITLFLAFVSAAAFSIWNELSTRYEVSLLATYRFMIPVVGVMLSVIFIDGETFSWSIVVGAVLVIVAMIMSQRLRS